jgi:hypothetical protein
LEDEGIEMVLQQAYSGCSNRVAALGAVVLYFAILYLWNDTSWRTEIAHAVSRHQQ